MKLKYTLTLLVVVTALATVAVLARSNGKGLVVHEWGTFTSLQGGDARLISWKPLKTSELPKFVYDWSKPDLGLQPASMLPSATKSVLETLQRMETPVVYFYSDQEQTVDLSVKFPHGTITEWFPRASQIGPSAVLPNHIGDASVTGTDSRESLIRWSNLRILPATDHAKITSLLPNDSSGSHYFAARDTDADFVVTKSNGKPDAQYEKFLFYRGVGNFATPLRVTMKSDDEVAVSCNAWTTLSHLFVLVVKDKAGHFVYIDQLGPGETKTVAINAQLPLLPPAALSEKISGEMSQALVKEGLYPREAKAMVNTWKDSWFAEDGVRVLYVLPRAWTDTTLPMTLNPEPKELVRVMVGRAEVLRPGVEQSLDLALDQAKHGDAAATERLRMTLKSLGRFAEPALYRAFARSKFRQDQNFQFATLLKEQNAAN